MECCCQTKMGSCTDFKWVAMVGDISNMYDELDPEAAESAVKLAPLNLPVWAKKRVLDRVNN